MENTYEYETHGIWTACLEIINGIFSVVLQAVLKPDYKFITTDVGAYRKENDSDIF